MSGTCRLVSAALFVLMTSFMPATIGMAQETGWGETGKVEVDSYFFKAVLNKDAADLFGRIPGLKFYSQGAYGAGWFAGSAGLNPRYTALFVQGRPVRDLRSGKVDMSLLPDYGYSAASFGGGVIGLGYSGARTDSARSTIFLKRGRGGFEDVNVAIEQSLSDVSSLKVQGEVRSQAGREVFTNYRARKFLGIYSKRYEAGWDVTLLSSHNYRSMKLPGPFTAYRFYEADGRIRDVTYDHSLLLSSPEKGAHLSVYISTKETKRSDTAAGLENRGLSYYYGAEGGKRLLSGGAGAVYLLGTEEVHSVRGMGYGRKSYFLSELHVAGRTEGSGRLRASGETGISGFSGFDAKAEFDGQMSFRVPWNARLYASLNRRAVAPAIDYLWMRSEWFTPDDTIGREEITTAAVGVMRESERTRWGLSLTRTGVDDPIVLRQGETYTPVREADFSFTSAEGHFERSIGEMGLAGISGWYNLEFDGEAAYSDQYRGFGYLRINRGLYEGRLKLSAQAEMHLMGERNRVSYEPIHDVLISVGGSTMPRTALFNVWITGKISSFTIFFRYDNVARTEYELIDGYPLTGMDNMWGLRWDFMD